ncbi:MAG: type II secretion system protein [Alphaproteobacteria bacterium]|nr:type II secretion system protein [Alphaproteobacteria bacterium]
MSFVHSRSPSVPRKSRRAFTLIELAVVLGILGIITAGLWRLMSTSTQQTKDMATAQQQLALIAAVKGYLADTTVTTGGQSLLSTAGAGKVFTLALPSTNVTGTCTWPAFTATMPSDTGLCSYLPSGFTSGTTNPYGQSYTIQVRTGSVSATQGYTFMVMTTGGSTISDTDGGRVPMTSNGRVTPHCCVTQAPAGRCVLYCTMGG